MINVRDIQLDLDLHNLENLIKELKVKLNEAESKATILRETLIKHHQLNEQPNKEEMQ